MLQINIAFFEQDSSHFLFFLFAQLTAKLCLTFPRKRKILLGLKDAAVSLIESAVLYIFKLKNLIDGGGVGGCATPLLPMTKPAHRKRSNSEEEVEMTEEKMLVCEWCCLSLWRGLLKASWLSINVFVPHWVCVCEAQAELTRSRVLTVKEAILYLRINTLKLGICSVNVRRDLRRCFPQLTKITLGFMEGLSRK